MNAQKIGGRFRIIKPIGGGSFGQTYLAEDCQKFNSFCVVKELNPIVSDRPEIFEMAQNLFEKEAKILHELSHLHSEIPYLVAYFQENQKFYLVQEFIEGHDLSFELIPKKKLPESEVILLLEDILIPLSFLHQKKIVHRDIKPTNLMRRKSDNKIVLIDFGAIKELASTEMLDRFGKTKIGTIIGTPGYMPSEQSIGKARLASDVYAVGAIAIQALTGLRPSQIEDNLETGELEWQHLAEVSYELKVILEKMVKYHFKHRYATAIEALAAIQGLNPELLRKERVKIKYSLPYPQVANYEKTLIQTSINNTRQTIAEEKIFTTHNDNPTVAIAQLNQPTLIKTSRRNTIKMLALGGAGACLAVATNKLVNSIYLNSKTVSLAPKSQLNASMRSPQLQTFSFPVITIDKKGVEVNQTLKAAQYFSEDLGNNIDLEMVVIPEGTFMMGSSENQKYAKNSEYPQHLVNIQSFAIGKFQITQQQWQQVASLPKISRDLDADPSYFKAKDRPVEQISWYDAIEFAARLSQKTGREYRLPSEAEWEYAARANTDTPFHFGPTISSDLVNYNTNYTYAFEPQGEFRDRTVAVGSFYPNAFGLYDMHGNVYEWCADDWADNYQNTPVDGSSWQESNNNLKVLRGGSWFADPIGCRSANREKDVPNLKYNTLGFRVACNYN